MRVKENLIDVLSTSCLQKRKETSPSKMGDKKKKIVQDYAMDYLVDMTDRETTDRSEKEGL